MLSGFDRMRQAELNLLLGDPSLKERLFDAGRNFWEAMAGRDTWPEPLTREADEMVETLFARGSMRATIDAMDELAARRAVRSMLRFCRSFRESCHGAAEPSLV